MSGIVGSKLNIRGSGLVGSLGTDGQHLLSAGAGKTNVFETVAAGGDNTPAFFAYRASTVFAVPTGAYTTVVFNAELYDSDGDYNTSTGEFTCSSTGKYFLGATIGKSVATATTRFVLSIQEDGSHFIFSETYANDTDGFPNITAIGTRILTSGRVYTAKAFHYTGADMDLTYSSGEGTTFFAFKLIGL